MTCNLRLVEFPEPEGHCSVAIGQKEAIPVRARNGAAKGRDHARQTLKITVGLAGVLLIVFYELEAIQSDMDCRAEAGLCRW